MAHPDNGRRDTQGEWIYKGEMWNPPWGPMHAVRAPALATHRDAMWCVFISKVTGENKLYYAKGNYQKWQMASQFTGAVASLTSPALASADGTLHAVFTLFNDSTYQLVHYQYNDATDRWSKVTGPVATSNRTPALANWHGQLYCAFTLNNTNSLQYVVWNAVDGWRTMDTCHGEMAAGSPALFVIDDRLHLLFADANDSRRIVELDYDEGNKHWNRSLNQPNEAANYGVNAAAHPGEAFMAFLKRDASDILVADYSGRRWYPNEVVGPTAYDTPALAIQGGYLNCCFVDNTTAQNLLWCNRPLDGFHIESWMYGLSANTPLSKISIPGTHDSCAVSTTPYVGTQYLTIIQQLNAGIRFFDLRCGISNGQLWMYHSGYPLNILLSDVLDGMYAWLIEHPSEALIASIKCDTGDCGVAFATQVHDLITSESNYWFITDTLPLLSAARRHIVLVRRYGASGTNAIGIDLSDWPDNQTFSKTTPGHVNFTIQDQYNISGYDLESVVQTKWNAIKPILTQATNDTTNRWYLNFTSAVARGDNTWASPIAIAVGALQDWVFTPGINPTLREYMTRTGHIIHYGTVIMDFPELPDPDLVLRIIKSNFLFSATGPRPKRTRA